jgi:tetratricopeptide (TPR) repeat protein
MIHDTTSLKSYFGLILLYPLCFFLLLPAYGNSIDSLRQVMRYSPNDSVKVLNGLSLGNQLRSKDLNQSQFYLESAFSLSKKLSFNKGIGLYYLYKGKTEGMLGHYPKAVELFDSALLHLKHIKGEEVSISQACLYKGMSLGYLDKHTAAFKAYTEGLTFVNPKEHYQEHISLLEAIGNVYNSLGFLDKALVYYERIFQLANTYKDDRMKHLALANKGQTLAGLGKYGDGLKMLLQVLSYFKTSGEAYQVSDILGNIAYIHATLGVYDKAIKSYDEAYQLAIQQNNQNHQLILAKNMAECHILMGNTLRADSLLKVLVKKFALTGNDFMVAEAYSVMGDLEFANKQYKKATGLYEKSHDVLKHSERFEKILNIKVSLAKAYFQNAAYSSSLNLLNWVESEALKSQKPSELKDVYYFKFRNFEQLGNYKEALKYHQLYTQIQDTLNVLKQLNEIEKINFEHETQEREQKIDWLQKESVLQTKLIVRKDIQKRLILGFSILALILAGISFWLYIKRKDSDFANQKVQLELKILKAQLNPHFVFNVLASIQGLIVSFDTNTASSYLVKFSQLMRFILDSSRKAKISLEKELSFLELYLFLESARMKNAFDYEINVEHVDDLSEIEIPSMLVQPLVENAVWHGMKNLNGKRGLITLNIKLLECDILEIRIKDNGNALAPKEVELKNNRLSHGLAITQERLNLMNKGKVGKAKLETRATEEGYVATVCIPIHA